MERLVVFHLPPPPLFSTIYQCDGCLSSQGGGVLPATGTVSILELADDGGNSRCLRY